ncbi:MAG TPA: hypothetical protein VJN95_12245 [Gemmatimonadales bacterium]|nr:hypothetical protein [Gemmatimonadales bacterium]
MKLAEWPARRIALLWIGLVLLYGALAVHGQLRDRRERRKWEEKVAGAVPIDTLPMSQSQRDSVRAMADSSVALVLGAVVSGLDHAPPVMWWVVAGVLFLFALPALLVVGVTVAWAIARYRARPQLEGNPLSR